MRTLHDCIVPPEMQLNRVLNKALALYDYTTTLHQEITTLWKRRKSLAAIVILVNRYALVAYALVSILMLLPFPVGGNPITDRVRCSHHTPFGNNTDVCQRCFSLIKLSRMLLRWRADTRCIAISRAVSVVFAIIFSTVGALHLVDNRRKLCLT